ncbi:MAG: type I methionyl aminopeptidase [Chloroflexi bacterium]|nr:type I methionyl aminopeptidase [Chloroflexota bacterium]
MIVLKSKNEIALMREAGRIAAQTLEELRARIKPGETTLDLNNFAHSFITQRNAKPAFKGYRGFPASICTSINDEIVHGIPNAKRVLRDGDIISVDVGAVYQGFIGDSAWTFPVGAISADAKKLLEVTEGALWAGILLARPGKYLEDISAAVQDFAETRGYNVVREYVGHGVGRTMHEEPQIPNYRQGKKGPLLKPGMTLAIEPMVNAGAWETRTLRDKWTVVTQDGKLSAHFEHTVLVTETEPEILTKL